MIYCNARCLHDKFTGIQRYTYEILKRSPSIVKLLPPAYMTGKLGHVWEHFIAPMEARNGVLWSASNTGSLVGRVTQVVTIHDLTTVLGKDSLSLPWRTRYYKWMLPRLLGRIEGILTVSEYSKSQILEYFNFPSDRVMATPLGVDHARFRVYSDADVEKYLSELGVRKGYVLSVGSGSSRKNLSGLLKAWEVAQKRLPDEIVMLIAGDAAAYGKAFDGTEVPPLPPRTQLAGRISDENLPLLLGGAGVFVFPSFSEGFGLPPLEAMACGTPVIASSTTSLPEVIGDAGLLVDPHSTEEIADAICRVLSNCDLQRVLRQQGLGRASLFDWDKTASATMAFLRQFE